MPARILLIEPSEEARSDFQKAIKNSQFLVVKEVGSGEEAVNCYEQVEPDLVVLDLSSPGFKDRSGEGGINIVKRLKSLHRAARILVSHTPQTKYLVMEAMRLGACGTIKKPYVPDKTIDGLGKAQGSQDGTVGVKMAGVRLKKSLPVFYKKTTDGFFTKQRNAVTEDISHSGIAIKTPEAIPEKTMLTIEVQLPSKTIKAKVQVVRSKPIVGIGLNELGCTYTEIAHADQELLKAFILEQVAKGPAKKR